MSAETTLTTCPQCGSSVRTGSDWCTLCFADLRPVPPPRPPLDLVSTAVPTTTAAAAQAWVAEPSIAATPGTPATATSADLTSSQPPRATAGTGGQVTLPCPSCTAPVLLDLATCTSCGSGLFDKLKEDQPTLTLPVVGDLMKLGKGARFGVAIGAAVVSLVLLFLIVTLLGMVF